MTPSDLSAELWPYRQVQAIAKPDWNAVRDADGAWLWVDGAQDQDLAREIAAIASPPDREWIWRNTPWEYAGPGYRQGPLLTRVNEVLMQRYVSEWAMKGAGLILFTNDRERLVLHLRNLRHITAANGDSVHFSLRALRRLEEFSEGLSREHLGRLLGPIRSMVWCLPGQPEGWRRIDNIVEDDTSLEHDGAFELSDDEETALNRASVTAFMRRAVGRLYLDHREDVQAMPPEKLKHQLEVFLNESQRIGLIHERDVFHYLRLRFVYPQGPFVLHQPANRILSDRDVHGRLRLREAEWVLEKHANGRT